jgi:serine/threonine protein kinase
MSSLIERTSFDRRLDAAVERFEESLQADPLSDVREFLPRERGEESSRIAVELLRVDLQYRWSRGDRKSAGQYRAEFAEWLVERSGDADDELAYEERRMADYVSSAAAGRVDSVASTHASPWSSGTAAVARASTVDGVADRARGDALRWLDRADRFPEVGDTLAEFRIEEELGRGAFARVYRAKQLGLADRDVVLKITADTTLEPDKLARLQHANIVPIYSLHAHEGLQVLCMPYMGRRTLRDSIVAAQQDGAVMDVGHGLRLIQQVLRGLQHAHHRGIVHRDIKPGNVLVADDGTAMLLDFNLSDDILSGGPLCTLVGGTLPYLAPEQLESLRTGERVGPQADIYSVGVMLFELLAGRPPFPVRRGALDEVLEPMRSDRRASPFLRDAVPGVPASVAWIVNRMLAPNPAARYATVDEVLADLDCHFQDRPLRFAPDRDPRERFGKFLRRHPRLSSATGVAAIASALLLGTAASWWSIHQRLQDSQSQQGWNELQSTMPGIRAALSLPGGPAPGLEASRDEATHQLERYEVAANDWRERPQVARLRGEQRRQLEVQLADLAYLLAGQELAAARSARDEAGRAGHLQAARQFNAWIANLDQEQSSAVAVQRDEIERMGGEAGVIAMAGAAAPAQPIATTTPEPSPSFARGGDGWRTTFGLMQQGEYGEAARWLESARDRHPHDASAWLLLGNAYAGSGRLDDALACYSVCVAMWPDSLVGRYQRGQCLFELQRYREAAADFSACLEREPGSVSVLASRAAARAQLDELLAARDDLDQAIEHDPENGRLYLQRAEVRRKLGEAPDTDWKAGLSLKPRDEAGWVQRGLAAAKTDPSQALEDFRQALQLNPRSRMALRNIAYVYGELQGRLDEAIPVLRQLFEQHRHLDDLVSLAVYHGRLGQREQALTAARQVQQATPTAKQWFQLACVHALLARASKQPGSSSDGVADSAARPAARPANEPAAAPAGQTESDIPRADIARAVYCLERALVSDGKWLSVAMVDRDLDALRDSQPFREVMEAARQRRLREAEMRR